MSELELCRICADLAVAASSTKLFERTQKKLLLQIKLLTGVKLKNGKYLPEYICERCQADVEHARKFRERCIKAQDYFASLEYKEKSNINVRRISGKYDLRDVTIAKTENVAKEEDDEISQIIIPKQELDPDDSSIETFNPLEVFEYNDVNKLQMNCKDDIFEPTNCTNNMQPAIVEIEKAIVKETAKGAADFDGERRTPRKKRKGRLEKKTDFICDQCGNHFNFRNHFLTHLKRHAGDKRFNCEICPCKFFTHGELKRHMRRHTGEKPFACKHCDRRFTDYSTRVKHERTHTNERPFGCVQCGKTFTTGYILKNHMLVHSGERSFRCEPCDKAFQRQTHLVVHCRSLMHKQNELKYTMANEMPQNQHSAPS